MLDVVRKISVTWALRKSNAKNCRDTGYFVSEIGRGDDDSQAQDNYKSPEVIN
jgi:hypothetical protein